jgi:hypothetical protein
MKETNLERHGVDNAMKKSEFKDKAKETNLEKYGVQYTFQSEEVKEKIKEKNLQKFGVENPMQNADIQEKSRQTNLQRLGVEYPSQSMEVRLKSIKTYIENYGVENPAQSEKVKEKMKQTNLERYGVSNPMQNAEISERALCNSYKLKIFTFPCGTDIKVQGYEPFSLKVLVEKGFRNEDIITDRTKVPVIWYERDGKKHRYYCDIHIPKINTIIEVKSTWTYLLGKDNDIPFKKQACIDAGYIFEIWIFDSKENLEKIL